MTAKVSKKNSFSTLSYQVLWLGSGIRPPRTIPLGPKKRKLKRRKEEDTPLTKEDKKELFRFALIFWPIIAIAIICIVMYIVELAMGYNETSPDSEILYKLGALDSYKIFEDQSWWHLLAYAFLHSSVRHLLGNVFSLLFISYFMIIEVKPTWQAVIFLVSS